MTERKYTLLTDLNNFTAEVIGKHWSLIAWKDGVGCLKAHKKPDNPDPGSEYYFVNYIEFTDLLNIPAVPIVDIKDSFLQTSPSYNENRFSNGFKKPVPGPSGWAVEKCNDKYVVGRNGGYLMLPKEQYEDLLIVLNDMKSFFQESLNKFNDKKA